MFITLLIYEIHVLVFIENLYAVKAIIKLWQFKLYHDLVEKYFIVLWQPKIIRLEMTYCQLSLQPKEFLIDIIAL